MQPRRRAHSACGVMPLRVALQKTMYGEEADKTSPLQYWSGPFEKLTRLGKVKDV